MVTDVFTFGVDDPQHAGRYVEITAPDHEAARADMFARFGAEWSMHYGGPEAALKAGVERFGLKRLAKITITVEEEWTV